MYIAHPFNSNANKQVCLSNLIQHFFEIMLPPPHPLLTNSMSGVMTHHVILQ